jgi:hypothetical protein
MSAAYKTYSLLTGDLFVRPDVASSKRMFGYSYKRRASVSIGIRPPIVAEGSKWDEPISQLGIELTPDSDLTTTGTFLPTLLADIRPQARDYFTKHKLLLSDQRTVHPWHVYAWSRKIAKDHRGFKVIARKDGTGGMILLPLDAGELQKLPAAIRRQEAADRKELDEQDIRIQALLRARPDIQAERAKQELQRAQGRIAATEEAIRMMKGANTSATPFRQASLAPGVQSRRASLMSSSAQKTSENGRSSRVAHRTSKSSL